MPAAVVTCATPFNIEWHRVFPNRVSFGLVEEKVKDHVIRTTYYKSVRGSNLCEEIPKEEFFAEKPVSSK